MNRDFKGVWIDKEIWLMEGLSCVDKCLLTEIQSLDNENHCFATNSYFANFLGVSVPTVTRSLKKLEALNMIKAEYKKNQNGTTRIIMALITPLIKMMRGANQNDETPTNQNDEHNNTEEVINTYINTVTKREGTKKKRFKPPSVDEVKSYCDSRNSPIDPKHFVDYYEAMDWHDIKGNKIKSWKGKIITWEQRDEKKQTETQKFQQLGAFTGSSGSVKMYGEGF